MRVGIGYDVHALAAGRKLIIGGAEIPWHRGLGGHSDADVLAHAIIDALLGAAALGDIGTHFPDTDAQYENISSLELLGRARELLREQGWHIGNIDATVLAQRPLFQPFIGQMRQNISRALAISESQVGIKATTGEGLGFAGREEGIAAWAVALVEKYGGKTDESF
ncbi:MAG: 2-C-methyl-D-erythritol 2,4-cyclodiphosphate synthase [Dehalococcoidia bacterium]